MNLNYFILILNNSIDSTRKTYTIILFNDIECIFSVENALTVPIILRISRGNNNKLQTICASLFCRLTYCSENKITDNLLIHPDFSFFHVKESVKYSYRYSNSKKKFTDKILFQSIDK